MRRLALVLCSVTAACATDGADGDPEWQTVTSRVGDTTVVRTTGVREEAAVRELAPEWSIGTIEGNSPYSFGQISEVAIGPGNDLFVFDRQPASLRHYDSTGKYVRTIGREGQGPGEYRSANGLGVHRDGRIALWDVGNRVNFYAPTGEPLGSTPVPGGGGFHTSGALHIDTLGNTYIRTRIADPPPGEDMQRTGRMFGITGLVRYGADRAVRDSLRVPEILIDVPRLIAQVKGSTSMNSVPFSPNFVWTLSPHGYFVSARTDVYAIDLTTPGGAVTRIEMDAEKVPVAAGEKANIEEVTTANMRQTDPNWRWNGPPIPEAKPYLRALSTDSDGRIWAAISRSGEEIPVEERAEARMQNGIAIPVRTWREPFAYDVFRPDGRYLGRVPMPPRSTWRGARGNLVWTVTRDSLDVEQITRFRISPALSR